MKNVLLILFVLSIPSICGAQKNISNVYAYNSSGYLYVLYFPNGKIIQTENLISNNADVGEMISRFEVLKRYGVITKAGAIILKAKAGIDFIFISEIFSLFDVAHEDRNLSVYINDQYVDRPETIVAEKSFITAVDIIKNPDNKEERIIDIITKGYKESKFKRTVNIPYSTFYLQSGEILALDSLLSNKNP